MASSDSLFIQSGFIEDGFWELPPAVVPVVIDLGTLGDPVFALPFRGTGGSVTDLDLFHGVIGQEGAEDDIQPIFVLQPRNNERYAFGREIPRQAILDEVVEARATLHTVEDFVVEGNPSGANLFGSVALTTRPVSSVMIDDPDGMLWTLDEQGLLLGALAAFYWDVSHTIVARELSGVVQSVDWDGTRCRITYGHASRKTRAPSVLTD